MEPCLFRHGKRLSRPPPTATRSLQWSHVFSDMVSARVALILRDRHGASMEPCLFRHGKGYLEGIDLVETGLQWSHVFSDMVRNRAPMCAARPGKLQWSHVFSDMVRQRKRVRHLGSRRASMEPCLFRHGKINEMKKRPNRAIMLQWSHVFSDMVRTCTTT